MSDQAEMQSPSISMEDRIGNILNPQNDQTQEQPEQQAQSTEPEFEEVEYEGERFQVPPKLKKGLMLNDDYTRKTQELSERRAIVETTQKQLQIAEQQQAFRREVATEREQVTLIDNYLKQPVDWQSLGVEDMLRKRAEYDQLKDKRAEILQSVQAKEYQFNEGIKGKLKEIAESVESTLSKKIPGWGGEVKKSVMDWAKTQGFTDQELASISNPVHAETLYKAAQYDKLVAGSKDAAAQASKATPMAKPGSSNPMPQQVKDKLNFQKAMAKATDPASQRTLIEGRVAGIFSRK